jgi:hypothetical protein
MAGAGYKLFNTGDVLTAAQVNTYLQEQVVMVFANATARTTALSGVLAEGMVSFLKDTDSLEIYSGTAWVAYGSGDITGITTGATSGLTGGVTSGTADLKFNTTAKGGLLVGTGSGTVSELAVGSNAQVLTADSTTATGLKWATTASSSPTYVGCSLYSDVGAVSTSNNTQTLLNWNLENFDSDAFHSTSSNTSRITIPSGKAGKYIIQAIFYWDNNSATGTRAMSLYKNGSAIYRNYTVGSTSVYMYSQLHTVVNAAVNDYFEIYAFQSSGGAMNVYTDSVSLFAASLVGA